MSLRERVNRELLADSASTRTNVQMVITAILLTVVHPIQQLILPAVLHNMTVLLINIVILHLTHVRSEYQSVAVTYLIQIASGLSIAH